MRFIDSNLALGPVDILAAMASPNDATIIVRPTASSHPPIELHPTRESVLALISSMASSSKADATSECGAANTMALSLPITQ